MTENASEVVVKRTIQQVFHFVIVGAVVNLFGYLVYLLITYIGVEPKIAMTMLYGVSVIMGFFGNRELTFEHTGSVSRSMIRYFLIYGVGYLLNLIILIVMVDNMGYAHELVQFGATVGLALYFFLGLKYYAFKR